MTDIQIKTAGNSERNMTVEMLYTAEDLGKELGTSSRNISQKWYPKLCEIFWWKADDLKKGNKYTAIAREEFIGLQCAISPKLPMRNEDNLILRDGENVLMEPNPDRIGIRRYKQQVWEKYNRFPEARVDQPTESQIVEAEICDFQDPSTVEALTLQEEGLLAFDDLGENMGNIFDVVEKAAAINGGLIVGVYSEKLSKTVSEGIQDVNANLGKAMNSRSQRRKS